MLCRIGVTNRMSCVVDLLIAQNIPFVYAIRGPCHPTHPLLCAEKSSENHDGLWHAKGKNVAAKIKWERGLLPLPSNGFSPVLKMIRYRRIVSTTANDANWETGVLECHVRLFPHHQEREKCQWK